MLAFARQAQFAGGIESKQVERQFAHHAKICCCLAQVNSAGVFAKCHVQTAMQSVLDATMESGCIQYHARIERHPTNQIADFRGLFAAPRGSPLFAQCS